MRFSEPKINNNNNESRLNSTLFHVPWAHRLHLKMFIKWAWYRFAAVAYCMVLNISISGLIINVDAATHTHTHDILIHTALCWLISPIVTFEQLRVLFNIFGLSNSDNTSALMNLPHHIVYGFISKWERKIAVETTIYQQFDWNYFFSISFQVGL